MATSLTTHRVTSWGEYVKIISSGHFRSWAFRGQEDAGWPVESSLSRYLRKFGVHESVWPAQEERVLRLFKRKAHLYLSHVPDEDDSLQWLALMQHHGTPTRLIDLTWSPYVAAYFALQRATATAAVWAICSPRIVFVPEQTLPSGEIIDVGEMFLRAKGDTFEKHFLPGNKRFVIINEPHVMNERLIAQSGTFAVPGVLTQPLEAVLLDCCQPERAVEKIELVAPAMRDEAMRQLYEMNITDATLFPGIDGMARSLAYELEYDWARDPKTLKEVPVFADLRNRPAPRASKRGR